MIAAQVQCAKLAECTYGIWNPSREVIMTQHQPPETAITNQVNSLITTLKSK